MQLEGPHRGRVDVMTMTTHRATTVNRRYSLTEARRRLAEILRRVRRGSRITLTNRGREVAEIVPLPLADGIERRDKRLVAAGILSPPSKTGPAAIRPIARIPGALRRFLRDRG